MAKKKYRIISKYIKHRRSKIDFFSVPRSLCLSNLDVNDSKTYVWSGNNFNIYFYRTKPRIEDYSLIVLITVTCYWCMYLTIKESISIQNRSSRKIYVVQTRYINLGERQTIFYMIYIFYFCEQYLFY